MQLKFIPVLILACGSAIVSAAPAPIIPPLDVEARGVPVSSPGPVLPEHILTYPSVVYPGAQTYHFCCTPAVARTRTRTHLPFRLLLALWYSTHYLSEAASIDATFVLCIYRRYN
ncbi:hypothetical protein BD779DRAFT_1513383, partial [Infundibulicybe gibba]